MVKGCADHGDCWRAVQSQDPSGWWKRLTADVAHGFLSGPPRFVLLIELHHLIGTIPFRLHVFIRARGAVTFVTGPTVLRRRGTYAHLLSDHQ